MTVINTPQGRLFIPERRERQTRVGSWMRLHCGDRVRDKHDERHEGRVDGITRFGTVIIKWDNGWQSEVPLERTERVP